MSDLRIVFMGTPDFAVTILDRILGDGYNIVGVITAPDKPAGRGRKLRASAVKQFAIEKNLNILQPTSLKNPDFLKELESLEADIQVVVAFRMLPKVVWSMPKKGTFNLHASLLPDYRGAAPIHWAIINGEEKTGVTTFFIDEKIDTGEIILKKEIEINNDETVGDLHDKLMFLGAEAVSETISLIQNNKVERIAQPKEETKLAPKLFPENCKIRWNENIDSIYNHIRGLNPFPAAWTEIQNGEDIISAKIYKVRKVKTDHQYTPGVIITAKKELRIAVPGGYILVDEIKLSGKKKMEISSLLNGFTFSSDAKIL